MRSIDYRITNEQDADGYVAYATCVEYLTRECSCDYGYGGQRGYYEDSTGHVSHPTL